MLHQALFFEYDNFENDNVALLFRYEKVFYSDCLHSSSAMQEENLVRTYE